MDLANTGGYVDAVQLVVVTVVAVAASLVLALVELKYYLNNRKRRKK